uniref:Growth hormone-inducible transmembrane protein n=2 Tax=Timema TaxID=61471 RepID=A0A7R9CJJ8_TIMPO|nr:unnamed protein product [Timema poppensis]
MLITRICQVSFAPVAKTYMRTTFQTTFPKGQPIRKYATEGRNFRERLAQRKTIGEQIMQPAGETAFNIGRGAVAGGAALGLGALCFYGLGLSKDASVIDQAVMWPQYVRDRIKTTYMYVAGSMFITAGSTMAALRSPRVMAFVSSNSLLSIAVTMAAVIGSGMVVQGIPYKKGFGTKQLAWIGHTALLGAVIAPICFLGGPVIIRAAWYTAGIVGGLSTLAVCAPSDKFLSMGGPLALAFGAVFAASIGNLFLPPTTALGAGLYSISMYGGLLVFSGLLLYKTQMIIRAAEVHPLNAPHPFDPVGAAVSIYLDILNIFIRMAMIMSGGGGGRKN